MVSFAPRSMAGAEEQLPTQPETMNSRLALQVLLVVCGLAACDRAPSPVPEQPAQSPRVGGEFRIAQIEPSHLDPARLSNSYQAALVNQIYDGLLRYDRNFNVLPAVAESWRISRDGKSYDFQLRHGIRFHNGEPLTCDDVIFSLTRVFELDPADAELAQSYLSVIEGAVAFQAGDLDEIPGLVRVNDYELRIELARPYASFLNVLASEMTRIVPADLLRADGPDALIHHPIGCGPFRLESWTEGRQIVLRRFAEYHGDPAHLDRLVYETPPDFVVEDALERFRAGEVHAVELTNGGEAAIPTLQHAVLHRRQELSLTYLGFDTTQQLFRDARVRRAVAHAIDPVPLAADAEARVPATGILPPGFPGYSPAQRLLPYDPDLARELLSESGARRPRFVLAVPNRSESTRALVGAMVDQLQAVGFRVEVQWHDWDSFDQGLRENSFDAFLLTWVADLPDPDSFFYPLFHSTGPVNYQHFRNAAVDTLLDQGRTGMTAGRRIDAYRAAERIVLEEAAIVPIHFSQTLVAVQPTVRGFALTSMGMGNVAMRNVCFELPGPEIAR